MIESVIRGVLLGLSLAAPPGPMNALIAKESSQGGALRGIQTGFAAPVADLCYLAVLLLARPVLESLGASVRILAALGGLLMAYLCYQTLQPPKEVPVATARSFGAAFLVAATNPFQLAWWLTAGVSFLALEGPIGIAGFVVGIFSWVVVFSVLIAMGARRFKWFEPTVRIASGIMLGLFAGILVVYALFGRAL